MLRHELGSMIHVPRLKDEKAAELFLGFRVGAVRCRDFANLRVLGKPEVIRFIRHAARWRRF